MITKLTRRSRGTIALATGTLALAVTLTACGGSSGGSDTASGGSSGSGDQVSVSLITKDSTNPFFVAMQKGAKEAAAKNNVKLTDRRRQGGRRRGQPRCRRSRTPSPAATRASSSRRTAPA